MKGTNTKIGGGGFHHLAMTVSDLDKSLSFYVDGLGFKVAKTWGAPEKPAALLDTGDGNYVELFSGRTEPAGDGMVAHFAIRTDDCTAAIEVARAAGAEVTVEAKNVDIQSDPPFPVRIAFFKGPDGEIVELFEER